MDTSFFKPPLSIKINGKNHLSMEVSLFRQIEGPSTVNMSTVRREFLIGITGLFVGDLETAK
jgi:hypothetical protein